MKLLKLVTAASLTLSLLSMWLADQFLTSRVAIVGSFAGLVRSLNPGIAFSIRLPPYIQEVVILAALSAVIWYARQAPRTVLNHVGFGFIIGGALGNVIDRLLDGYVTDYFQVGSFPVFNTADSFITVGVILLLLGLVMDHRAQKAQ